MVPFQSSDKGDQDKRCKSDEQLSGPVDQVGAAIAMGDAVMVLPVNASHICDNGDERGSSQEGQVTSMPHEKVDPDFCWIARGVAIIESHRADRLVGTGMRLDVVPYRRP